MTTSCALRFALAALTLAAVAVGQVRLHKQPVVYLGCAANTTAPATLVAADVRSATPEWRLIERERVDLDSARGRQLCAAMGRRIRAAVREVAVASGRDLVVRAGDVRDDRGRTVMDLTTAVVAQLGL